MFIFCNLIPCGDDSVPSRKNGRNNCVEECIFDYFQLHFQQKLAPTGFPLKRFFYRLALGRQNLQLGKK